MDKYLPSLSSQVGHTQSSRTKPQVPTAVTCSATCLQCIANLPLPVSLPHLTVLPGASSQIIHLPSNSCLGSTSGGTQPMKHPIHVCPIHTSMVPLSVHTCAGHDCPVHRYSSPSALYTGALCTRVLHTSVHCPGTQYPVLSQEAQPLTLLRWWRLW